MCHVPYHSRIDKLLHEYFFNTYMKIEGTPASRHRQTEAYYISDYTLNIEDCKLEIKSQQIRTKWIKIKFVLIFSM